MCSAHRIFAHATKQKEVRALTHNKQEGTEAKKCQSNVAKNERPIWARFECVSWKCAFVVRMR